MPKFDHLDPANHGRPLWFVYGAKCFPTIVYAKLVAYDANLRRLPVGERGPMICIWGYSVYRGEPGFRTLGTNFEEWARQSTLKPYGFADQEEALALLRRLTRPKVSP